MRVPGLLQLLASRVKCRPVPPMLTSSELHTRTAADKVRCQHHACGAHGLSCGQPERRSRKRAAESPAAANRPSRHGDPNHPPGVAFSQPPPAPCGREQQLYGDTRVSGVRYLDLPAEPNARLCGSASPQHAYLTHDALLALLPPLAATARAVHRHSRPPRSAGAPVTSLPTAPPRPRTSRPCPTRTTARSPCTWTTWRRARCGPTSRTPTPCQTWTLSPS